MEIGELGYDDADDFSLDAEDRAKVQGRREWYLVEKGRVDRIALLCFHNIDHTAVRQARRKTPGMSEEEIKTLARSVLDERAKSLGKSRDQLTKVERLNLEDLKFKRLAAHYREDLGYILSRIGKDGQEADDIWMKLSEPRTYFTTLVLVYPTTREGEVVKDAIAKNCKVLPWRFSGERYNEIYKRSASLASNNIMIASQDLSIECTDTKFQKISIDPKGPAIYRRNPQFMAQILTRAVEQYDKLIPFREMSTADLRIKLGLGAGSSTDIGIGDDFGNVLEAI